MSETASVSSSSAASRAELAVDLLARGLLPPLPTAYLEGRDRDLLAPLTFLSPGELPAVAGPTSIDRRPLARALAVANRAYGHPQADELARRIADPATRVVVTGQQPGLFGGPLYTFSKMIAASRWAAEIEAAGEPAVAVFWVATEDHDWAEVASATVLTRDGSESLSLGPDPDPLVPVGMRSLGNGLTGVFERLEELFSGDRYGDWLETLGRWYRPDARFGEAFCRLMVHCLGERTPLLLDSMLPEVKALERPWLARFIERRDAVEEALERADREIESRGYPLQVTPQRGASPLFLFDCGERRRIEWRDGGEYALRGRDDCRGTIAELAARLEDNPLLVSPGVLARPAVQDALLGTTLQVLGPGEVSYMAQAAAVYPVIEVPAPALTLRPQALVLESHLVGKLEQTGVDLADLLGEEQALERLLAERQGSDLGAAPRRRVEEALEELKAESLEIDPNLERPWEKTRDQVGKALDLFTGKLVAAAARANEVQAARIDQLRQASLPGGRLQERVVSSAHFPGKYREQLAEAYWRQLDLDPRKLSVIVP